MKDILTFIRHNSGIVIGSAMIPFVLIYAYSCQSVVVSGLQPGKKINRQQLVNEVDFFLAEAEAKFADLDRQDLVKDTIFNSILDLAQGKTPNPIGVVLTLASILGAGAGIDNIRKRTHINTLKGGNIHGEIKEAIKEAVNARTPPTILD